jgi:hypothetical protein
MRQKYERCVSCVKSIQHSGLVNEVNDLMSFGNLVKVAVVTRLQLGRITLKGFKATRLLRSSWSLRIGSHSRVQTFA